MRAVPPRLRAPLLGLVSATAIAAACGGGSATRQGSASTGPGGASSASAGSGGKASASSATASTTSSAGAGGGAASILTLPQFVHGAAYADNAFFPSIPVMVTVGGAMPTSVEVALDSAAPVPATLGPDGYVATLDVTPLDPGVHTLVATAKSGAAVTGTVKGALTVAGGSAQLTVFAEDGPAYDGHLVNDVDGDALAYTWVSEASGKHQLYLNHFDGAFTRLAPADVVLNDPSDEPLTGYTAFGPTGIGVVYMVAKPGSGNWLVHMRVTDATGKDTVPTMDLTQGEAAFAIQAAGADPGGFSGAWLHISDTPDGGSPPPVEIRFSRWDVASNQLVGPLTLDSDQPQAAGSTQGPQTLEPLGEISIACNTDVCLVAYVRDVYDVEVELNTPKVLLAVVDLHTGTLAATPEPVEASDWDAQLFGNHLAVLADGSFVLVYEAVDTATAVNPLTPCDQSLERDLFFAVTIDAAGALQGKPQPVFDFQGSREYPRIAQHPAGFALFWEDQRDECDDSGQHIAMAANVVAPGLTSLLDPYVELPGSIGLPPEDPTLAVTGTNFAVAWSDDRHGEGLAAPEPELYLDTYWRR